MKRVLAVLLLLGSTAQANELKKAWDNFGKKNRLVSAGKTATVGLATYAMARACLHMAKGTVHLFGSEEGFLDQKTYNVFGKDIQDRKLFWAFYLSGLTGLTGYAAFNLGYYQLWHDAKHALNVEQGYFS